MKRFQLDLGDAKYIVNISKNIITKIDEYISSNKFSGQVVIVVDEYIKNKYLQDKKLINKNPRIYIYTLPGEKNNKTFYSALKLFEYLDENNISRDSTIIAIGGGVIGDLAGFVSSCWYRGVNLVHMPTTLLSAVDSCVGGKTAINFRNTVNAVGTYYHPSSIWIDTSVLFGLPEREISSGFAEIIKYAMLGNQEIMKILLDEDYKFQKKLDVLIELSLKEKEKFVSNDVFESSKRLYLNFGHTIGHAIEFATIFNGKESLRHGEGVGLGMLAIFAIGRNLGYLTNNDFDLLKYILLKFKLPIIFSASKLGLSRDALVEKIVQLCFKDKKRTHNDLRLVLLNGIGNPFIYKTSDKSLIAKGVNEVIA